MRFRIAVALFLVCVCACQRDHAHHPGNSVATFLANAERQAETDEQRSEIQRALHDMLDKSPGDLRQMRYADYTGQVNQWSIIQLLVHYFVPNPPAALDETKFYQDTRTPAARAAIKHQLDELTRVQQ